MQRVVGSDANPRRRVMIGILLTVLVAALVFLILAALTNWIVATIAAILVLIAGIPSGGFGFGSRWGGRRTV